MSQTTVVPTIGSLSPEPPMLSATFVITEMLGVERRGLDPWRMQAWKLTYQGRASHWRR